MKLHSENQQSEVITNNTSTQKNTYKIAASAKAFAILSSNIYSNKIRAIVRELSSNAVDAHIAANNTEKFDVVLPTVLDPMFRIRDYGIGLSHEDVMEVFQTYFESTKTNSNLFVGALGLGSKSPFSYTTTFTIVSYFNNVMSTYVAFIDNGFPTTQLVSSEPTEEHNGLLIQVPVKSADVDRWVSEAEYVYSTFSNILPNFPEAHPDFKIDYIKLNSDGYLLTEDSRFGTGIAFIMGGVRYPLNMESCPIPEKATVIQSLNKYGYLQKQSLLIDIPIGFADIEPGREGLSYDTTTEANIKNKLIEVSNIIVKNYVKQLLECKSGRELYKVNYTIPNILNSAEYKKPRDLFGRVTSLENIIGFHDWTKNDYLTNKKLTVGGHGVRINPGGHNSAYNSLYPLLNGSLAIDREALFGPNAKVTLIIEDSSKNIARSRLNLIKAHRNKMKSINDQFESSVYIIHNPNTQVGYSAFYSLLKNILGEDLRVYEYNREQIDEILDEFYDPTVDSDQSKVKSGRTSNRFQSQRSAIQEDQYEITKSSTIFKEHLSYDLTPTEAIEFLIEKAKDPSNHFVAYYYHNTFPIDRWDERVNIRNNCRDFNLDQSLISDLNIPHIGRPNDKTKVNIIRITSKIMPYVLKAIESGELKSYNCAFKTIVIPQVDKMLRVFKEDQGITPIVVLRRLTSTVETFEAMLKEYNKFGRIPELGQQNITNWHEYKNIFHPMWDYEQVNKNVIEYSVAVALNNNSTRVSKDLLVDYWKLSKPHAFIDARDHKEHMKISIKYNQLMDQYKNIVSKVKHTVGNNRTLDLAIAHYKTYNITTTSNRYNPSTAYEELGHKLYEFTNEDFALLYSIRSYIREAFGVQDQKEIDMMYDWARKTLDYLTEKYSKDN